MKQTSYIQKLIHQGEGQCLDFKYEISDAGKIARSISAFANTDGGILLIGVKDNGNIAGVKSEEEIYMADAAAKLYCKPEITYKTRQWNEGGKTVLEIIIPKINDEICYALDEQKKWRAWIRVNDSNRLANKVMIRVWKRKIAGSATYLTYTEHEKLLLNYLTQNGFITRNKFCRLTGIPSGKAENILVNLIMIGLIDIIFDDQGAKYRLI